MAARKRTSRKKPAPTRPRANAKVKKVQPSRKPAYGSFAKLKWQHLPAPITEPKITVQDGVTFVRHPWRLGESTKDVVYADGKRIERFGPPPVLVPAWTDFSSKFVSRNELRRALVRAFYKSDPPLDWLPVFHPMRRFPKPKPTMSQDEVVDAWNSLPTESKAAIEKSIREAQARASQSRSRRRN